ncbi:hypothetical protein HOLleu_35440 [Holothuria leucospilota]|uniref:Endonuclease-reverse transcriptase n=1 Tax=Holothuria leucospilota TaxID=206669 RepID=A0A9Q0YPQ5_HOLLE|nr:hypothetical protein HOLleu_35440 [Holothuria leucospilota]
MRMNTRSDQKLKINNEDVEDVHEFTYLESKLNKSGGGSEDTKHRLAKAWSSFRKLTKICYQENIQRRTKIPLYKSLVRSVLLYGCETWKLTQHEERKLDTFQYKCLKTILRIRFPQTISYEEMEDVIKLEGMSHEIRRTRWNWIGHVLRKGNKNDTFIVVEWRPEGTRCRKA